MAWLALLIVWAGLVSLELVFPSPSNVGIIYYLLFVPINAYIYIYIYIYIKILNCVTDAPTCFGASAPSSGSFEFVFAKVIKY